MYIRIPTHIYIIIHNQQAINNVIEVVDILTFMFTISHPSVSSVIVPAGNVIRV